MKYILNRSFIITFLVLVYILLCLRIIDTGYFIWDDKVFLFDPLITKGNWLDLLFKSHYGLYHPVTSLFVRAHYLIHGNNSQVMHVTGIVIHLLNSLLILWILRQSGFRGVIGFAVFLFHPLACEAVFWITSLKDLLFVFFGLLSITAYLKYLNNPGRLIWFLITCFCVCLALLSKVQAIVIPFILLLIDFSRQRSTLKTVLEKVPLVIIAAALVIVSIYFRNLDSDLSPLNTLGLTDRILNAVVILLRYLVNLLIPVQQSVFYPRHNYSLLTALILITLLLVIAFFLFRLKRSFFYLFAAAVVCFMPVLQILPIGDSEINDRYIYPAIAILAVSIEYLYVRIKSGIIAKVIVGIYMVFLMVSFIRNLGLWTDQKTLFENSLKKYPESAVVANTLGVLYLHDNDFKNAGVHFDKAIHLEPDFAQAFYNKGLMYEKMTDDDKSLSYQKKAINLYPRYEDALYRISLIYYRHNEYDSSEVYMGRLLKLTNKNAAAYDLAGKLAYARGNVDRSIEFYKRAIRLEEDNPVYLYNLSVSLGYRGDYTASIKTLDKCLTINPSFHQAYYLRGIAKIKAGRDGCKDLEIARQKGNTDAIKAIAGLCNQ